MTIKEITPQIIDKTDKQILELLQDNAKLTIKEISEKTGKSQTAIRERIKRLEESLIKKYTAIIDCRKLGYKEMIMATLTVNTTHQLEDIREQLNKIEEIKYAYVVTGDSPLFIMAKCLDHEDAMKLIVRLRNLPGVEEVKTQLVLDCIREDHTIIIPKS